MVVIIFEFNPHGQCSLIAICIPCRAKLIKQRVHMQGSSIASPRSQRSHAGAQCRECAQTYTQALRKPTPSGLKAETRCRHADCMESRSRQTDTRGQQPSRAHREHRQKLGSSSLATYKRFAEQNAYLHHLSSEMQIALTVLLRLRAISSH